MLKPLTASNGHAVLAGSALTLVRLLDRIFLDWAEEWGAEELLFPAVIGAEHLAQVGYFQSFPHLATFPVALDRRDGNVSEFAERNRTWSGELGRLAPARAVLTPAACYHVYPYFRGQAFERARVVTTQATCFRCEDEFVPLERQWSFSMREIVFIGSADEVKSCLQRARDRVTQFLADVELPVTWQIATDPFFPGPQGAAKAIAQLVEPVKHEMTYENRLAVGSTNYHRNFFGEAFNLVRGGAPAHSGCIAFGLERWVAMVSSSFGLDAGRWPAPLRERASSCAR